MKRKRRLTECLKNMLRRDGREYICQGCKCDKYEKFDHDGETKWVWQGWPIRLEVDHVDENPQNESLSNLQYLCKNCHNQKTYASQRAKLLSNGPLSKSQLKHLRFRKQYRKFGLEVPKTTNFSTLDYTFKKTNRKRKSHQLRQWILESGREYICESCRCEQYDLHQGKWQWNGAALYLEVDHIKPRRSNACDRVENIRFLCPNCHSQTSTYVGGAQGM